MEDNSPPVSEADPNEVLDGRRLSGRKKVKKNTVKADKD